MTMVERKRFYLNTSSMTARLVVPRSERALWNFYPRQEPKIRSVEGGPHFYGNGFDDDAPWLQYQMDLADATDKVVRLPEASVYLLSPVRSPPALPLRKPATPDTARIAHFAPRACSMISCNSVTLAAVLSSVSVKFSSLISSLAIRSISLSVMLTTHTNSRGILLPRVAS